MASDLNSIAAKVSRAFRTREIYVRSEGHVRYMTLKPHTQVLMICLPLGLMVAGVAGGFGLHKTLSSNTQAQVSPDVAKNLATLDSVHTSATPTTKKLTTSGTHTNMPKAMRASYEQQLAKFQSSLNHANARLANRKKINGKELDQLLKKYSSLEKRHFELEDLLDQGWTPRMVSAPAVPEELPQDKQPQIQGKMPAIETDISPSKTPAEHSSIDTNSPVVAAISTAAEVLDLKLSMKDHWEKQNLTNTKIALSAHRRMKEMVGVLTGLNFDISKLKLTTLANRGNIGGPLVKLTSSNPEKFSGNDFASLALFEKIYLMETALLELPIHRPVFPTNPMTSPGFMRSPVWT